MTAKDFTELARILALCFERSHNCYDCGEVIIDPMETVLETFLEELARTNPSFDKEKFIKATNANEHINAYWIEKNGRV